MSDNAERPDVPAVYQLVGFQRPDQLDQAFGIDDEKLRTSTHVISFPADPAVREEILDSIHDRSRRIE